MIEPMKPMLFYRVAFHADGGSSAGFGWYNSRSEAEAAIKYHNRHNGVADWAALETCWIEPTRGGILEALRRIAKHPDNG